MSVVAALYATSFSLGQSLTSTLTNEPSPSPAPAPAPTTKHTAVEQDQTALFQTTAWKKTSVDDAATSATAWKSNFVALPSPRHRRDAGRSPRHRRDAGRESQLWGSSQILSYFIRLVIAARRTLSVDERLGSSPWAARGVSRELVPARWRGSSTSRFSITAAPSPRNDLVKNYQVHLTHWLISTQVRHLRGDEGHCLR